MTAVQTIPLSDQLSEIKAQLEQLSNRISALVQSLNNDRLKQRPTGGGWSVAECIMHLTITTREYLPLLDQALADARQLSPINNVKYRMDFKGRLLKWMIEPPARLRVKTTEKFTPISVEPLDQLLPAFQQMQQELIKRVAQANKLPIDKIKVTSPFDARMQYNLYSCLLIVAAHQRRHLWQAEQVLNKI